MKRAILFLNSEIIGAVRFDSGALAPDLVICVDGGVRHARNLAIRPHVILGDFDSLPPKTKEFYKTAPVEWISHPPGKDQYETDSELAIRVAKERGVTECVIYGFSGSRLDHMSANLFLFARYAKTMRISVVEPHQQLTFVTKTCEWKGEPGDLISLIPLSRHVHGITTKNLHYPLTGASLKLGTTKGISNVMLSSSASVHIRSGILLTIHTTAS